MMIILSSCSSIDSHLQPGIGSGAQLRDDDDEHHEGGAAVEEHGWRVVLPVHGGVEHHLHT